MSNRSRIPIQRRFFFSFSVAKKIKSAQNSNKENLKCPFFEPRRGVS